MNIFDNIQYLNTAQAAPLMAPQASGSSTNNAYDINLAAALGLFQSQPQQQFAQNTIQPQFQAPIEQYNNLNGCMNSNQYALNNSTLSLQQNLPQGGISTMNQSALMQLEALQQIQLIKQQQQQQDQQREQYKLALITELLKLEQQTQPQQVQQNQFSGLMGMNELSVQNQFNQQQQQQPNTSNLLLELIIQQNKINAQANQQTTPSSYLSDIQTQQNCLIQQQTSAQSPKCADTNFESKTLSFIPSIASGSPQLMAQISPQLKKEDDNISAVQLAQQNTQHFRSATECPKNNAPSSLSQMMELQDIMNTTQINQQNCEMNQHDTNSLTKIFTQSNFDNSLFSSTQQQNIQANKQQQQLIADGNNQNLDINIFLKQQNNEEFLEIQKKRQDRLIKIEKYKNKRRNWLRKISYDCRKKVADSRLRIKGRFISKKDTEKIKELIGDNQEAFNAKKNLRLDFMNSKMRLQNLDLNPAISKNEILCQIEKLLLKNRQIHTTQTMQSIVKRIQKKQQVFCLIKRGQTEMIKFSSNSGASMHFSEHTEDSSSICENSKVSGSQN